jgi:hypothetical protein
MQIFLGVFRPTQHSGLRFVLASFAVIGVLVALTYRIVPAGFEHSFNNGGWFLVQSKYVAWIFAVEVLQALYWRIVALYVQLALTAGAIVVGAVALSTTATVEHLVMQHDLIASTGTHWQSSFEAVAVKR